MRTFIYRSISEIVENRQIKLIEQIKMLSLRNVENSLMRYMEVVKYIKEVK